MLIYCLTDNKPGHKSQLEGLMAAMGKLQPITIQWLSATADTSKLPACDLIVAAGHKTHWPTLKLKWRFKCPTIVIMKPSLPRFLFDLCIIPRHDGVKDSHNVFTTLGAMNNIKPATTTNKNKGLILIGGPSKHFDWDSQPIIDQLRQIKALNPDVFWSLTTSRRTPKKFLSQLTNASIEDDRLSIFSVESTNKAWLISQFKASSQIWVTEDSVSMVYESLSTGANVGLLKLNARKGNRLSLGLQPLIQAGQLHYLNTTPSPETNAPPLQEADRAAAFIEQWLKHKIPPSHAQ